MSSGFAKKVRFSRKDFGGGREARGGLPRKYEQSVKKTEVFFKKEEKKLTSIYIYDKI